MINSHPSESNNKVEKIDVEDKNLSSYFRLPESVKDYFHQQEIVKNERKKQKWICIVGGVTLVICIVLMIIVIAVTQQGSESFFNFHSDGNSSKTFRVVFRSEWHAQPPKEPLTPLKTPVTNVIILHTGTVYCSTKAHCKTLVKSIQNSQIKEQDLYDIEYNFLIGGDGKAYEGRGWQFEGPFDYDFSSIGIAFIGNYSNATPPDSQILTAKKLIALGVNLGYIADSYKLLTYTPLLTAQSPLALFEEVESWSHWTVSQSSD